MTIKSATAIPASLLFLSACAAREPAGDEPPTASVREDSLSSGGPRRGCEVIRCKAGFVCQDDGPRPVCVPETPPEPRECAQDADCSLVADYCGGCNCLSLAPGELPPKCSEDEVACFVWPCRDQVARCLEGRCELDAASF